MKRAAYALFVALLTLSLGPLARGSELGGDQLSDLGSVKLKTPSVRVAPVATVSVSQGKSSQVQLDFRVADGFHINSHQPKSDLLVPTAIRFEPPTNLAIGKISYPAGQDLTFDFAPQEKLNVYTGDFRVTALVRAARSMPPGTFRVRGTLKYQACDNKQCFPPSQLPLAFDVKVKKVSSRSASRNTGQSPHIHR